MAFYKGFITIVAFTDSGRMRQVRFRKEVLLFLLAFGLFFLVSSAFSLVKLLQSQHYRARAVRLEEENRHLLALLKNHAAELNRLKREVERLKGFEQKLKIISGFEPESVEEKGKD